MYIYIYIMPVDYNNHNSNLIDSSFFQRKQDEQMFEQAKMAAKMAAKGHGRLRTSSGMDSLQDLPLASVKTRDIHLEESMNMSFKPPPRTLQDSLSQHELTGSTASPTDGDASPQDGLISVCIN